MSKIKFKDLSFWLKTSVVLSFIVGSFYFLIFLFGFIAGIMEVLV